MSPTLLEMSKELVTELIRVHQVPADEVQELLANTHATLQRLNHSETHKSGPESTGAAAGAVTTDWKRSIQKHSVACLECGASFRQLSARHLSTHDLTPRTYRQKYGIPLNQPLSAREVTIRRRQLAKDIQPWLQARTKRKAAKKR